LYCADALHYKASILAHQYPAGAAAHNARWRAAKRARVKIAAAKKKAILA